MKTNIARLIVAATLPVAPYAVAQSEAPVQIKTDHLPATVAARLQAKAQEGPSSLIRYVYRNRMLYPYVSIDEIVVPAEAARMAEAAKKETLVATAKEPQKK